MKLTSLLALFALSVSPGLAAPLAAQDLCEGNGYGGAYISVGPAYLGGNFVHDIGSPNAAGTFAVFSYSDGFQETVHPTIGPLCLNVFSSAYGIIVLPVDATGNLHFSIALPNIPSWVSLAPFYSNVVTFEGGQWSMSKTVPLWFENPNSWSAVSPMSEGRMYHTATNLGADGYDNRIKVLVAGGGPGTTSVPQATDTTELFDPLSRTFAAGPTMAVERTAHTATRLDDGRVLLVGGIDSAGVANTTCELYDRATDTLTVTGSLSSPRSGHTATLLDDGRVLVTGGFADYQNPQTEWIAALNTAQDTAEIFDPATGTWSPVAQPMASKRAGHTATKLQDGKVLLVCGINGGGDGVALIGSLGSNQVPFYTPTVELFDPATETFSAQAPLHVPVLFGTIGGGRAFHGASVLPNGDVLVTGGIYAGGQYYEALSTIDAQVWNGTEWELRSPLPTPMAWHSQLTLRSGKVLVSAGLNSLASGIQTKVFTGLHDGTTLVGQNPPGLNPGLPGGGTLEIRGAMSATMLHDGSVLFLGGTTDGAQTTTLASGYVYTPAP